jgi:hypothetical protein
MTLRELAEKFTKDYEFIIFWADGTKDGKYERNEIVKFDYYISKLDVINWAANCELPQTINVKIKLGVE